MILNLDVKKNKIKNNKFFEKLINKVETHDIISFDIFDTLLVRPYVKPTDLFIHMEELSKENNFAQLRIQAEKNARKKYYNQEDITIDQIYDELDNKYKYLKLKEINLEKRILKPHPQIKKIYDYALSLNKKIIITSDMYLPKSCLVEVLKNNGYDNYYKFYLSNELMKTKDHGSLYSYIINDLQVKPKSILHIGDNYHSDFEIANNNGIDGYFYPKIMDIFFSDNPKAKIFYDQMSSKIGCSIIIGLLALCDIQKENDYWKHFGFTYAGPTIFAYVKWLDEQFKKDNINNALFIARDGYTLQKVFELIKTSNTKSNYIYAPRILNLICNLAYEDRFKIDAEGFSAINTILTYFKDKNDFLRNNTPSIKTKEEGEIFLKKHIDLYIDLANIEKNKYKTYFNNLNIKNSDNNSVIDTASGFLSSQKFIENILNEKIIGYYWFTWERTIQEKKEYSFKTFQKTHEQSFLDWDLMEFFMTSPEPPIQNVINGRPIYKKVSEAEITRINTYPFVSEGVIEFCKLLKSCFGDCDLFIDCDLIINWINILSKNPTNFDKKRLSTIKHAWDSNHDNYIPVMRSWFTKNQNNYETYKVYLLGFIPILKIKSYIHKNKYFLFNFLPILKISKNPNKKIFFYSDLYHY